MRTFVASLSTVLLVPTICAAGLNDTGQTFCYDSAGAPVSCSAAVGGDAGTNPRQDPRFGRDAQAVAGTLTKIGAGAAGFDFTKIANDGTALTASAALGAAATDWACTKDNVTGLIWEVKTTAGLRSRAHRYSWYSTEANNGGNAGDVGGSTCGGTLAGGQCNTQSFVAAVNAATLCGASDWRLPTPKELSGILHTGEAIPAIDASYFPNTVADLHWTSSTYVFGLDKAWFVEFYDGNSDAAGKASAQYIRLVRRGQ